MAPQGALGTASGRAVGRLGAQGAVLDVDCGSARVRSHKISLSSLGPRALSWGNETDTKIFAVPGSVASSTLPTGPAIRRHTSTTSIPAGHAHLRRDLDHPSTSRQARSRNRPVQWARDWYLNAHLAAT